MKKEALVKKLDILLSQQRKNSMSTIISATKEIGLKFFSIDCSRKEEVIEDYSKYFIERCYVQIKGEEASSPSFTPIFAERGL